MDPRYNIAKTIHAPCAPALSVCAACTYGAMSLLYHQAHLSHDVITQCHFPGPTLAPAVRDSQADLYVVARLFHC